MHSHHHSAIVLALLLAGTSAATAAERRELRETPFLIAELNVRGASLRFEQFGSLLLLSEISDPTQAKSAPIVAGLLTTAAKQSIHLCPAQIYGLLSSAPIPAALWRACADPMAAGQLKTLQAQAQAKVFRIFVDPIVSIGSYCVGATGYQSFAAGECNPMLSQLYGDTFYDSDNSYWCANTLKSSTDRSMSIQLGDEGEAARISAVSCTGNTRFRFYKRDSTSSAWVNYRDYQLGPSQHIALYSYDTDQFGDSDFRFRLDSSSGAWHRSTGYFIDD